MPLYDLKVTGRHFVCVMVPEGETGRNSMVSMEMDILQITIFKCRHFRFTKTIHTVKVAWYIQLYLCCWTFVGFSDYYIVTFKAKTNQSTSPSHLGANS